MTSYLWTGKANDNKLATAGNWNPVGVPGGADTATFDSHADNLQGSLTVSQFVVTDSKAADVTVALKNGSKSAISAGSETIGNDGTVQFDLEDNSNTITSSLIVGNLNNAIAEFHQDGGTVSVGTNETIGMSGTGTFDQQSGTHTITGNLTLGQSGNASSGKFDLKAGTLTVNGNEVVGGEGKGEVGQGGGTHIVKGTLTIGGQGGPESTFHLDGGTLTVGTLATQANEIIGAHADGRLDQTGGSNSVIGGVIVGLSSLLEGSGTEGFYTLNSGSQFSAANLTIGVFGKGTVDVNSNSTATIAGPVNLGTQIGSNGTLEVIGATFTASGVGTASTLNVGVNATGVLDIENGGTVTANFVTLAVNATGNTGIGSSIKGSGSLLTVNNDLIVGKLGGATLSVDDHAKISANHIVVGSGGQAAMLVKDGAEVASKTSIEIGVGSGSQGAIAVVGGTLSAATTLTIGVSGTGGLAGGSGGVVSAASVIVGKNGGLEAGSANLSGPLQNKFQGDLTIQSSSLTNNGGIVVDANSTLHLTAGVVNNSKTGTALVNLGSELIFENSNVTVNNQGTIFNQGLLEVTGIATLQGGGKIIQADLNAGPVSPIGGATLINVDNTYSGAGSILLDLINQAKGTINGNGNNFALTIHNKSTTNNGIIEGTTAKGVIFKSDVGSNAGTIEALGLNARVEIDHVGITNTATGVILASGAGAHVDLDGATVTGGTFKTALGGVIDITSNSTINGVTNLGALVVTDGTALHVTGSTFNNSKTGVVTIMGDTNGTKLFVDSDLTLQGAGKIILAGAGAHGSIQSNGSDVTLTNVDNNISGAGSIGDSHFTLINQAKGVINGNDASNTLALSTGKHTITNAGILEGTTAQGLFIGSDIANSNLIEALGTNAKVEIDNASIVNTTKGVVLASGAGAHVDLDGVSITGGTLRTTGLGAAINLDGGGNVFDGSGVGLPLNIAGILNLDNGGSLQLKGTINNTGTMTLGSTGNDTDLIISGVVTLASTGHVTLTDNVHNAIESNGSAATLINVANTISGAGTIDDDNLTLDNQAKGIINAVGTHALIIDVGIFTNEGKLEATGSGGLMIAETTVTTSAKGLLTTLAAGSHIDLDHATINGGLVTVVAGSQIDTRDDEASSITASKITNAGTIIADGGDLDVTGAIINTGKLAADNGYTLDIHGIVTGKGGTATIAHGGILEFEAASSANVDFLSDHTDTGTLRLDAATNTVSRFTGTIANFDQGNHVELGALDYLASKANIVSFVENATQTSGVLTLSDANGHTLALTFLGNYAVTDFDTKADSNLHVDLLHV